MKKKASKTFTTLIFILLGIILYVMIVQPEGMKKPPPKPLSAEKLQEIERKAQIRSQRNFEREIIYKAQKAVKAELKNPDSAKWKFVQFAEDEEVGAFAYGFVDSKNSFGAYTGFQRFIANRKQVLIEEQTPQFEVYWQKYTQQ